MALVRWKFEDFVSSETYTFAVNPSAGGSPARQKSITYQSSAAADGSNIIMEGRDTPSTSEFSGTLLTEAQYNAFDTWYSKRHQILLTDDLGRQLWIYITSFTPQRERSFKFPWKHSYTVSFTILDVA